MAKVLGESGRYVTEAAVKQRLRTLLIVCINIALLGVIEGLTLSSYISLASLPWWINPLLTIGALVGIIALWRWGNKRIDELERRRAALQRGATGENLVAEKLASFPDDFCVINDLTTPFGNLDHVVVGPTGVYVLDAKNWRGVVAPDGKGELLLNGQPTDKPQMRHFVSRIMSIKEKVRALAPGLDPFFQPAFVFTSARVEAKWGSTGSVHCVSDDQLHDYVVNKNFGKRLSAAEVQTIAQAFLGLAHMDREFPAGNTKPATRPNESH